MHLFKIDKVNNIVFDFPLSYICKANQSVNSLQISFMGSVLFKATNSVQITLSSYSIRLNSENTNKV